VCGTETQASQCRRQTYELFSILVHSGGAYGGHYFAYIKCFEDGKWYEFNDSSVFHLSEEDIERCYGGSGNGGTAYMLMYRQVNETRNIASVSDGMIPPLCKEIIAEAEAAATSAAETEAAKANIKTLSLRHNDKEWSLGEVDSSMSVGEFRDLVVSVAKVDVESVDVRLRRVRQFSDKLTEAISLDGEGTVGQTLPRWDTLFALETKNKDASWRIVDNDTIVIRLCVEEGDGFAMPLDVSLSPSASVADLRVAAAHAMGVEPSTATLLKVCSDLPSEVILPAEDVSVLHIAGIYDSSCIFAVPRVLDEITKPLQDTIDKAVRRVIIIYSDLDSRDLTHVAVVSTSITLRDLKNRIAEELGVEASSFRVSRQMINDDIEISRLNESLSTNGIYGLSSHHLKERLFLRRPVPLERNLQLVLLCPDKAATARGEEPDVMVDVGEAVLDVAGADVAVVKVDVARCLVEHGVVEEPAEDVACRLRLREMARTTGEPGVALLDDQPIRQQYFDPADGQKLGVQVLASGGETKKTESEWVLEVSRWHPDTLQLGPRHELVVSRDTSLDVFNAMLSEVSGIAPDKLRAARAKWYVNTSVLELSTLPWADLSVAPSDDDTFPFNIFGGGRQLYQTDKIHLADGCVVCACPACEAPHPLQLCDGRGHRAWDGGRGEDATTQRLVIHHGAEGGR